MSFLTSLFQGIGSLAGGGGAGGEGGGGGIMDMIMKAIGGIGEAVKGCCGCGGGCGGCCGGGCCGPQADVGI